MEKECVVLIHGFARSSYSMSKINKRLQKHGYVTIPIDYPSRKYTIEQITEKFVIPKIKNEITKYSKVHFVGYSLGGIITRYFLSINRPANLGKVVFIATPNKGVEIVTHLGKYQWFKSIFGYAVNQLAENSEFLSSLPQEVDYEAAVISGNFSTNPITSLFIIPGEDDGTVSVESTKINGMKDHVIYSKTHMLLLHYEKVAESAEHFIAHGKF